MNNSADMKVPRVCLAQDTSVPSTLGLPLFKRHFQEAEVTKLNIEYLLCAKYCARGVEWHLPSFLHHYKP